MRVAPWMWEIHSTPFPNGTSAIADLKTLTLWCRRGLAELEMARESGGDRLATAAS